MRVRLAIALALILPSLAYGLESSPAFVVIVNRRNPSESLDRKFLAAAFLKKISHWPDDSAIEPVDLQPESQARRRFSKEVLSRSVMGVKSYWQQMIFSGEDVPPPELQSDQEVIEFVRKNQGSIGYVSGSAVAADSDATAVKPINIR